MAYLPPFCTESDIARRFDSAEAVGMCACCSAVIYADMDALHLPNGSLCAQCLADLSDAELCEWTDAIAPVFWTETERAVLRAEVLEHRT